jgi:hypothetical protein
MSRYDETMIMARSAYKGMASNEQGSPTRRARGRLDSHRQNGLFRDFGFLAVSWASLVPPAAGIP